MLYRSALLALAAGGSSAVGQCGSSFDFSDFSGAAGGQLTLAGSAAISGNVLRVTPDVRSQAGAAWYTTTRSGVGDGFSTSFAFRITNGSADGLAFVIQTQGSNVVGGAGNAMGYGGISRSVAVEFDTYAESGEDDAPHISVQSRGNSPNQSADAASIAMASIPYGIDDDRLHTVLITYVPMQLTVNLDDGAVVLNVVLDLHNIYGEDILNGPGPNECAWVGFTGGTGDATANQDIERWRFDDGCVPVAFAGAPESGEQPAGGRSEFAVQVNGTQPVAFSWQHDGVALTDGDRISGTATGTVVIDPLRSGDAGVYQYTATNACGTVSGEFTLSVRCYADFNEDGGIDGGDIEAFFDHWEDGDSQADVNGDGGVDGGDVQTFFTAWENGGC